MLLKIGEPGTVYAVNGDCRHCPYSAPSAYCLRHNQFVRADIYHVNKHMKRCPRVPQPSYCHVTMVVVNQFGELSVIEGREDGDGSKSSETARDQAD